MPNLVVSWYWMMHLSYSLHVASAKMCYPEKMQSCGLLSLMTVICHSQDWTPLDRNWIRGRVALMDVNLGAACHLGTLAGAAESTLPDELSPLYNFDTEVITLIVQLLAGPNSKINTNHIIEDSAIYLWFFFGLSLLARKGVVQLKPCLGFQHKMDLEDA